MTLLDRIRTAPADAQVSILYRSGTKGETTGGEDIYSIEELRSLMATEPAMAAVTHFYPGNENHRFDDDASCPCRPTKNDLGIVHRSWTGKPIHH